MRLHVFDDRVEASVGATLAITLPWVYCVNHERARRIDYRHLMSALARNALLFGASGVGKTHLAAAIGHAATERNVRVRYANTTALMQQL